MNCKRNIKLLFVVGLLSCSIFFILTKDGVWKEELNFRLSQLSTTQLNAVEDLPPITFNVTEMDIMMENRRMVIKRRCDIVKGHMFFRPNLYSFTKLGLTWCPSFKSGSTVWKDYFVKKLVNSTLQHPHIKYLGKFSLKGGRMDYLQGKEIYSREAPNSTRFFVVRNPFVRIISYWHMAKNCEITSSKYLEDLLTNRFVEKSLQSRISKFKQEVQGLKQWCLSEKKAKGAEMISPDKFTSYSKDNPFLNPPYITFSELVDHIEEQRNRLRSGDWEGHWAPSSEWCDVCRNKFDYIIKLENEPEELLYFLQKVGLHEDRDELLSIHNNSTSKPTNQNDIQPFISQLNDHQKHFLNNFYQNDLIMFGYDEIR